MTGACCSSSGPTTSSRPLWFSRRASIPTTRRWCCAAWRRWCRSSRAIYATAAGPSSTVAIRPRRARTVRSSAPPRCPAFTSCAACRAGASWPRRRPASCWVLTSPASPTPSWQFGSCCRATKTASTALVSSAANSPPASSDRGDSRRRTRDLRRDDLPAIAVADVDVDVAAHSGLAVLGGPMSCAADQGDVAVEAQVDVGQSVLGELRRLGGHAQKRSLVEDRAVRVDADDLTREHAPVPLDVAAQRCCDILLVETPDLLFARHRASSESMPKW